MSPVAAVTICLLLYFIGYRFYARYLAQRVFRLDDGRVTPAHELNNGVDFVPSKRFVLFGHHFASITGLSPMLGPAIAVIWGWLPAMIWVVFGSLLIGCVHDFAALVLSIRSRGESIGKVAESVIGPRAKGLFLVIIFFGVSLAMGVFTLIIAKLFSSNYGSAVIPSGGLMLVAGVIGFLFYKRNIPLLPLTIIGFLLQLLLVWLGSENPVLWESSNGWMILLLAYAFLASVLPVWSLLQPRDFLNSLLLYLGLGLCYAGFFLSDPEFAAPAFDPSPEGAPSFFPFVFITIACGAASGFHSLVSSGTTSKQLDRETDAKLVGYGAMIGESLLGLLAILATTAGFAATSGHNAAAHWEEHYASWDAAKGLSAKLSAFIEGAASFLSTFGISAELATSFIAVIVVSFALTTLDSATRLLRYNVEEIGASLRIRPLRNRFLSTGVAILAIGFFAFYRIDGKPAGLSLWAIFGTVNQLLAGLALLVATLYLLARRRNYLVTGVPMVFMLVTTIVAMILNIRRFMEKGEWPLLLLTILLAVLALWLIIEAWIVIVRRPRAG